MTPRHYDHAIRTAIARAAHDGLVNPNDVRPLIPAWVLPKQIGLTYRRLRQDGVLVEFDHVRSTDVAGRNVGKMVPRYRLTRPVPIGEPDAPPPLPVTRPRREQQTGPCAGCQAEIVRYGEQGRTLCTLCAS